MKITSATKALQNLGEWSESYAWIEYGLTKEEVDRSAKKVIAEIKKERKEGKLKPWNPAGLDERNFAKQCAKLDPKLEQAMAEEGMSL